MTKDYIYRVGRGGSWYDDAVLCRSAYRYYWFDPGYRLSYLGFRLAKKKIPGYVRRGCSWFNPARACRSAFSAQYEPDDRSGSIGFRVARTRMAK